MPKGTVSIVLSCEHGGNVVPSEYRQLFLGQARRLRTHEGFDLGALSLAESLSKELTAALVFSTTTRLLVDLNRSLHNPRRFSDITRACPADIRSGIIDKHYLPYRKRLIACVAHALRKSRPVIHISVHSFTPVLRGRVRQAEIGLLYDPRRARESRFASRWREYLRAEFDGYRIRMNYPYRGVSDSAVKELRSIYRPEEYLGFEIEVKNLLLRAKQATLVAGISRAVLGAVRSVGRS